MLNSSASTITSNHSTPIEFVCPMTKEIMKDSVIAAINGHSYEKAAIEALMAANPDAFLDKRLYPNWALKKLIEDFKSNSQQTSSTPDYPNEFKCSISHDTMINSATTTSGHSYERKYVKIWFNTHNTDPVTGENLTDKSLASNYALMSYIQNFSNGNLAFTSELNLQPSTILPTWLVIQNTIQDQINNQLLSELQNEPVDINYVFHLLKQNAAIPANIYTTLIPPLANELSLLKNEMNRPLWPAAMRLSFLDEDGYIDEVILSALFCEIFGIYLLAHEKNYVANILGSVLIAVGTFMLGLKLLAFSYSMYRAQRHASITHARQEYNKLIQDAVPIFSSLIEKNHIPQQTDIDLAVEHELSEELLSTLRSVVTVNPTVYAADINHTPTIWSNGHIKTKTYNEEKEEESAPLYSSNV